MRNISTYPAAISGAIPPRYGSRRLTHREETVVALVALGYRNRDVAQAIGSTEQTIKNYLYGIFNKLGMSNRVELTLWHQAHGADRAPHAGDNCPRV